MSGIPSSAMLTALAATLLLVPASVLSTDYCSLKCGKWTHTMCLYPEAGLSDQCSLLEDSAEVSHVTAEQQAAIIEAHNRIREDVRVGTYAENGLPAAAAMPPLQWDEELASVAQRWANQCQGGHDKCRKSSRWYVGQNAAFMWHSKSSTLPDWERHAVNRWFFGELPNFQQDTLKFSGKDQVSGKTIGHLTQVIWAKTTLVGCGYTKTKSGKWTKYSYYCNYGRGGNMKGGRIYEPKQE